MFRYILTLLLINTSYQSLGAPTNPNATVSLANLLISLANHCENAFLTNQIKSQIESCSDLKAIHGEKQLRCLMFYDINNQLCSAIGDAKLAITEDYTEKINEEQNVNSLCEHAKDWTFSNVTEFPRYKQAVDKVFKHPVACGNICGAEDFLSEDVNFYCKYFNWGFVMLKQKVSTQDAPHLVPLEDKVSETKPVVPPVNYDLADLQIKTGEPKPSEVPSAKINEVVKSEPTSVNVNQLTNTPSAISATQNKEPVAPEDLPTEEEKPSKMSPVKTDASDTAAGETKPETIEEAHKPEDGLKTGVDKEIQLLNNELEKKEAAVLENPKSKIPNDPEDYQDSDEGKDGLGDIQGGDDGDDPVLEDLNNKPKHDESVKRIETISTFTGERDSKDAIDGLGDIEGGDDGDDPRVDNPNNYQDRLTPDEDNFFPFFLTAIILVVLLYILYHNKSKVSKWFFGLVLEGRQSNRRRNSRGHAYKRLDTLEQAMAANTAAPPSKIIY